MDAEIELTIDIVGFVLQVIAVGLGVFLGFCADRYREGGSEKKRVARVLNMLRDELIRNLVAIGIIRGHLEKDRIPFEHIKTDCWAAVADKVNLVENGELLMKIMRVYYSYDTFERAIKLLYEEKMAVAVQSNEQIRKGLVGLVKERQEVLIKHIATSKNSDGNPDDLISLTRDTIAGIEVEMKRLDANFSE